MAGRKKQTETEKADEGVELPAPALPEQPAPAQPQNLEYAHNLVREALVIVGRHRGIDNRSEVIAAENGLKKADLWIGEILRNPLGAGK